MSVDSPLSGALSYVFEKEVCSKCIILRNGEPVPPEDPDKGQERVLFLIDCLERDFERELPALTPGEGFRAVNVAAALFNLQRGTGIERRAFNKGIKGFFYRDDNLHQILKGIKLLLRGETWVSRDILVEVALQGRTKSARATSTGAALTRRETQILVLLSMGSSNDEVAEKLFISPNTVKTHLYRIFRKIKVPNRFQAALWAAKNL